MHYTIEHHCGRGGGCGHVSIRRYSDRNVLDYLRIPDPVLLNNAPIRYRFTEFQLLGHNDENRPSKFVVPCDSETQAIYNSLLLLVQEEFKERTYA